MAYEFAVGYNNEAGLTVVSIQPSCPGIAVTLVTDGHGVARVKGKGASEWLYDPALPAGDFADLLAELGGLNYYDTPSVECTIQTTLNDDATGLNRDFGIFNAVLTIPPQPRFKYFWQPIVFSLLIDLEPL